MEKYPPWVRIKHNSNLKIITFAHILMPLHSPTHVSQESGFANVAVEKKMNELKLIAIQEYEPKLRNHRVF